MFIERILDKLFKFQLITDGCEGSETDGQLYLKRWFIYNDNSGPVNKPHIYLHHIVRSDRDREFHDHPWKFVAIILWGGYTEETSKGREFIRPGRIISRPATWQHRVQLDKPSWSLVFTGKKERSWGFWTKDGFLGWKEWGVRRCKELADIKALKKGFWLEIDR